MQKSTLLVDDNGAISQDLENYLLKRTYTHFVVKKHPFCSLIFLQTILSRFRSHLGPHWGVIVENITFQM
jgi:hypothetical protein